ncbi:DNA methyltransferase, partial [Aquifex pyrophilus]
MKSDDKERKFFKALKELFIGEKVEGKSGYINLMKIKSKYYEKVVYPRLKRDIEEALKEFPEFREELFDKLYDFFSVYFSESGSIYFAKTPLYKDIYEKIYTDERDVILFWKTRGLYYIKTDKIFKSLNLELNGIRFHFDASDIEYKKANEKRELIYELKEISDDKNVIFSVKYSERGRKTNKKEILKELKKNGIDLGEEELERAFRIFEKQGEVDFFLNKNPREFLREQFELWLYRYLFKGSNVWNEKRIKQIQVLRDIALKIINFISQFEEELVKVWNKPRFVLNSNYVITLNRIAEREGGLKVIEKIIKHKNFEKQVQEWKSLKIVDEKFRGEDIIFEGKLNDKYRFLPVDTKYFKDLEGEIISLFDNLDEALDGWLIKSENYQALNTILPKFKGEVQTIYIDPPFNKEQEADYFYSVKYKDATWITMLENRLRLAREFLKDTGSIFVRCDYNGNMYVKLLMNEIFG